ncbi:MAG TPA: F0F1 ATP synthase subunit A [Terriglobales bacterium]|nr:F0F1 ATP synthase subunit A [Terriglobales bacterium]
MPEQLWFTAILNHLFAAPVTALLRMLHVEPKFPNAPIPNSAAMEVLVVVFLIALFALIRSRLSVENPGGLQHMTEVLTGFVADQAHEIIGHGSEKYVAFLGALGFFILTCNLLGLVPGFESPTAVAVVPLGCALCAFFYYHAQGFRAHGIAYLKHFVGPIWWLFIIMIPIEIISHLARVLSLSVRLYANMFAGDMVTFVFFSLVPVGVPVVFMGLHIGVALLQAYIFVLLTMVYLSGAVADEH